MARVRSWWFLTLCPAATLIAASAFAQSPCDASLQPEINPTIQYRERADDIRCEGFYRAKVASGSGDLEVVGLLQRPLRFSAGDDVLRIRSMVAEQPVGVRGQGIPIKLYYRFDAELPPGGTMNWPIRLIHDEGLEADEIGVFARFPDRDDWYVPVDIVGRNPPPESPRLLLRASVEISEVDWRYAPVIDDRCGKMTGWEQLDEPAGFSAGEAIPIQLPDKSQGRKLCLEVAARGLDSGSWLKLKPVARIWR